MNRSMEAHKQFKDNGLNVTSFGVGSKVRLPSPEGPMPFEFESSYSDIKNALVANGDLQWFRERGFLDMLDRNIQIKEHPERFQDYKDVAQFKVVFCFEERVYDILVTDVKARQPSDYKMMHILNLDVKDDSREAVKGAEIALALCKLCVEHKDELDDKLPELIKQIEDQYKRRITHLTHLL
mmetsp:Transcript_1190/g.2377  ORF Transcript_1190/g.2377 Transcript_1190/m.2377 type:complete len:182 (+) Transcript_1190:1322-1867(+)